MRSAPTISIEWIAIEGQCNVCIPSLYVTSFSQTPIYPIATSCVIPRTIESAPLVNPSLNSSITTHLVCYTILNLCYYAGGLKTARFDSGSYSWEIAGVPIGLSLCKMKPPMEEILIQYEATANDLYCIDQGAKRVRFLGVSNFSPEIFFLNYSFRIVHQHSI